jgi:integrase
MAKSNSKTRTRSDKFPLILHRTGQYCKKIKGKFYYFGTDKQQALERYREQAAYLHMGKGRRPKSASESISLKTLCNLYLDHQESRAAVAEVKLRHVYDQILILRNFVKFVGSNRFVSEISTIDLQSYRKKLIKAAKTPNTINNHISTVKAMYNWALDNEIIEFAPRLKAVKKITSSKQEKPTFTMSEIQKLLRHASTQMKAMIWLGLNCGFGCTDCAELKWNDLDLANGRVKLARKKTGISRNLPLWPETIQSLAKIPKSGKLVFYALRDKPLIRTTCYINEDGSNKYCSFNLVTSRFSKLMKRAGIPAPKGTGFYTLRRTAATIAARSGDPFAVQRWLGRANLKIATRYVQDVSAQTDQVIENSRKYVI